MVSAFIECRDHRNAATYYADQPPSIPTIEPVMNAAWSLAIQAAR